MIVGRSMRHLASVRRQVRRMNEGARVVAAELDRREGLDIVELDTITELDWSDRPIIGFRA